MKKREQENVAKTASENISKRYPNGRTLKTQDKYLPTDKKGNSDNPKSQRRVVIIDSNRLDEVAVVRLTSQKQPNTSPLKGYTSKNGKQTSFKHFVEIVDGEGNAIKVDGEKFIENPWIYDLTPKQIAIVKKRVLEQTAQAADNKNKIAALKARGDKKDKKKR